MLKVAFGAINVSAVGLNVALGAQEVAFGTINVSAVGLNAASDTLEVAPGVINVSAVGLNVAFSGRIAAFAGRNPAAGPQLFIGG